MRLLEVVVPEEQRGAVLDVLRDRQFGYTVLRTAHDQDEFVVQFVAPADAVEYVLAELEEVGLDRTRFTVSVNADFATFQNVDEVQDTWADTPNRIAPVTLRSKAKSLRLNTFSYVWMMFLSTVVAAAGLLLGSPAVVVGSMVLAPIVSPMLTTMVGAVRNDRDMVVQSLHLQLLGLGVAIVGAVGLGVLMRTTMVVPPALDVGNLELIALRFSPGLLSVVVGLAAGAAGAFGLATKGQVSIVGVMIAAALIPTAATAGIGFAWGRYLLGLGAVLLLLLTIVAVNLGGYVMLRYLGYGQDAVDETLFTVHSAKQAAVVGGTILLVVGVTLLAVVGSVQHLAFERAANDAASEVMRDAEYRTLGLTDLSIEYTGVGPLSNPTTVTVTATRTADRSYPDLPGALERRIADQTGENVTVRVRYLDYEVTNASRSGRLADG